MDTAAEVSSPVTPKTVFTKAQLKGLIIPLIFEQLLSLLVGMADSMMVASVNEASVCAVSLVDAICSLMIAIFSAMAAGGAAVAGQYIGRKESDNARKACQHLLILLIVSSAALTFLMYVFKLWILRTIYGSIEPDVMAATQVYYGIVMASIPGIALYNGGAAMFRAMGKSRVTFWVSLLMNAINISGNAILIFGFNMDVAGVAIPTLVSRTVAAVVILTLLANPKRMLNITKLREFRLSKKMMQNIFYISIPSGVENGMFYFGRLALASMVSSMGTVSTTANSIANTLGNFHHFVGSGINLGLTQIIAQCAGGGDYEGAKYYLNKFTKIIYKAMTAINLLGIALLPLILMCYTKISSEARHLVIILFLIHGIASIIFWTPAFTFPVFLRATGDARITMIISVVSMWGIRVLFAYIFGIALGFGVIGVWCAHSVLDWIVRGFVFYRRIRSGKWVTKAIKS